MADKLRFGLIGCGEIAVETSKAIIASDLAEVVVCMDVVEGMAADLAGTHGARSTTSFEEVLADEQVQAVVLSTPHYLHVTQTVAAAEAGKHVLVEKPIACDLVQADTMIAATEKAGVKLDVLYPARFGFQAEKVRELYQAGALGKILAIHFDNMSAKPEKYWKGGWTGRIQTDWRMSREKAGGGVTIMNLSHNIDAMIYALDMKPTRLFAEFDNFRTPQVDVEDFLAFTMRLEGGTIVSLNAASGCVADDIRGDIIYGDKGQIAMRYNFFRVFLTEPFGDIPAGEWHDMPLPKDRNDGRLVHVNGFAKAVLQGATEPVPGPQARRALEIVRAAYISGQTHEVVHFPVQE